MTNLTACIAKQLGQQVERHRIRIAALSYATNATVEFAFWDHSHGDTEVHYHGGNQGSLLGEDRDSAAVAGALEDLSAKYLQPDAAGVYPLTEANLHGALHEAQRSLLNTSVAPFSGFRANNLHIMVLTDGLIDDAVRSNQTFICMCRHQRTRALTH